VYYATAAGDEAGGFDGGIMVTASHNPPDYNGMKFVREGSRPISADTGLKDIAAMIRERRLPPPAAERGASLGRRHHLETAKPYVDHLLGYVDRSALRKLKS
jgi:phosphomannomutase